MAGEVWIDQAQERQKARAYLDHLPPAQLSAAVYGDYVPNPAEVAGRLAKERNLSDACRGQIQHDLQLLGPLPETADEARDVAAKFPGARLVLAPDWIPISWTPAERAKGQAWGLKTIESFHTHGTPPVG